MKKFLFLAVAAIGLLATSCSKDETTNALPEGDAKVTFTVVAPELQTRTIGDGTTATSLWYAVYDANWNHIAYLDNTTAVAINLQTNVELELIDGKTYNLIFWAANADAPYTFDRANKEVTIDYTGIKANHEKHDAFYQIVENLTVKAGLQETVELYRPFAQLNIATSDWSTIENSGEVFDKTKVEVKAYNTLNLVDGKVSGGEVRTFDLEVMPTETLKVNNVDYKWLAMNYLLVNEKELVEVTFNANNTDVAEKVWYNVPVERNHRTHILGKLLTSPVDFEIIIRPAFEEEPGYIYDVWDGTKTPVTPTAEGVYEIKTGSELAWFASEITASAATFNNKTVKLMADLDMSEHEWTPIKTWGSGNFTFDGNGHEISGLNIDAEGDSVGFIGSNSANWTISNLTFVDSQISATEKFIGTLFGYQYGHVVLNNVDVKGGYIEGRNHFSIRIGGLIGFSVTNDGATLAMTDCDVDGVTIRGYHNLAGLVGTVIEPDATMDNCTSTNNKFILTNAKQTTATESAWWPFDANAYKEGASIKTNCTHSGNTSEYVGRSVATVDELVNAVKGAAKGEIFNIAEGTYPVVLDVVGQKDITLKANGEVILAGLDHQTNGVPSTVKVEGITFDNSIVTTRAEGGWFTGTSPNMAPCVGAWGGHFTFDDCKFIVAGTSGRETGIMTWWTVDLVTFKFNNCVFEGKDNHASARAMQIYGKVDMEVNNCTFTTAKDYSLKYVAGEGNVAVFNGNKVENSENFVELGSSVYPGDKYTVKINNTTLGTGVNHYVVANPENQTIYIDNKLDKLVSEEVEDVASAEELTEAIKNVDASKTTVINVATGEYTMPSGLNKNVTLNCAEGTVFTGQSNLNISGATVIGATFSNPTGSATRNTINGTFKGCTFDGSNASRYNYAGETVVFEDCVFSGDVYGIHFDGGENDVIFRNCTISGFNALGSALTLVTFEGCTFKGNGRSGYNGANLWGSAKMVNCEFTFDGTTSNEWIDCIGADKTYEFENCTVNGVAYTADNYTEYGDIFSHNNTVVKINGVDCQM